MDSRFFSSDFSAKVNREMTDEVVKNFEDTVNELKKPFLNATSVSTNAEGGDEEQDVEGVLKTVEGRLDSLHSSIKGIIDANGDAQAGGNSLDTHSLHRIFERKNIFSALKANPELKEALLRSLHLLLKEYPFTRSVSHVRQLKDTPSYPVEIIPNKV